MPWHFEKTGPKLEFLPGPSPEPDSKQWSKTYPSFNAVKGGALDYLGGLHRELAAKQERDEVEEHLMGQIKQRAQELRALTLNDLPEEMLGEDNYDEAYERASYLVEVQRARRRPMAGLVFLAIGVLLIIYTLIKG